ncbi:MAG: hypothetical protein Q8L66_15100 [Caulobacter sp.]|nr:hypothetical protein [Caulobacter sp.]
MRRTGSLQHNQALADAEHRFSRSLLALQQVIEEKQHYNPAQPRQPKGVSTGGQWAGSGNWGGLSARARSGMAAGGARLSAFVDKHHKEITRVLGAAQALGGGVEAVGGVAVAASGAATSGTGAGILVAGVGAWMVTNGYDNLTTGWNALLTGEPQETTLHKNLRGLGLKDDHATAVEILLSGGGLVGARLGGHAFEQAAKAELLRRAARAFDPKAALPLRVSGGAIWEVKDIRLRGDAWEAFDAKRTGYNRYPHAPVLDQISADGKIAVSNKTLDLHRETYLATDRKALYQTLKRYIDQAARYTPASRKLKQPLRLSERRIHLLLRSGDAAPGQALQLAAAEAYAERAGVILKVEYAR